MVDRGLPAAAACSRLPAGEGLWKGLVDILWSAFVQIADETGLVLRLLQGQTILETSRTNNYGVRMRDAAQNLTNVLPVTVNGSY